MKKPMMSSETQRPVKPLEPEPWKRGPSTADLDADMKAKGLTPLEFCIRFALADEWATFARAVGARVAKEPKEVWESCLKCGRVSTRRYRDKPGRPCIFCNYPAFLDGGFMADMSAAAVTAHLAAKAAAEAQAVERDRRAALYAANESRLKSGLKPLSLAEFIASEKERARKIMGGFPRPAATAKDRDERMARAGIEASPGPDAELKQGRDQAVAVVNRKGRAAQAGKGA